jgi:hypothetical protein
VSGGAEPGGAAADPGDEDVEVVDALPVPGGAWPVEPQRRGAPPVARQAAAVAATGFVAGAATVLAARQARGARRRRRERRAQLPVTVVASRSFLIDVHLLAPRGE